MVNFVGVGYTRDVELYHLKTPGKIASDIDVSHGRVFDKFHTNLPDVIAHLTDVRPNLKSVVLFGTETHVS